MKIKCERVDDFGRGIGYYDKKIVFIPGLLPSEVAEVKIVEDKKNYMEGEIIGIINKSDKRVCPRCPYKYCGCSLNIMSYSDTLEYKKKKVNNILKKYANISFDLDIVFDREYGYRNKVTLKVKDGKLGYYKNGTHDLISIDRCLIASSKINEVIDILKKIDLSDVFEIVIKSMDEVMVIINGKMDISYLKDFVNSIYMNGELVYGKDKILSHIGNYKFYVSKDSFFQINSFVTSKMYDKIIKYAGNGDKAVDLFCGCGTISMFLSDNFKEVVGVEINSEAIEMAKLNMILNDKKINFVCGDANKIIKGVKCDTLVVDPARSGLKEIGVNNILDISPLKIVYVSCNPVTLARDLKLLSSKYLVKDITLFDMFPFTYHVECVCLLEKRLALIK